LEVLYYGELPRVLIYSGIHGDEHQPIKSLETAVSKTMTKNPRDIGPCVFIPRLHEEALLQGRRGYRGSDGADNDLNRKFQNLLTELSYPKAVQLLKIFSVFQDVEYVFSFHADNEPFTKQLGANNKIVDVENGAYIYDIPMYESEENSQEAAVQKIVDRCMEEFRSTCSKNQIRMLEGWDDINDPVLRNYVSDGYVRTPTVKGIDGSFESYTVELGRLGFTKVKRAFSFETPGWISEEKRFLYISSIVEVFIVPFLRNVRNIETIESLVS
jgi:hypothetical protein